MTGPDAWSRDAAFSDAADSLARAVDTAPMWEGHKAGRDIGHRDLEKLHRLAALPADGVTVSCFPHKTKGASAGWTRAVAILGGEAA